MSGYHSTLPSINELVLKSKLESNTFHAAMKLPIQIAQSFGYFPIYVGGDTYRSLKMNWFYWRVAYSLVTIFVFVVKTGFTINNKLPVHNNIITIDGIIFYINGVVQAILFFKLATEWPSYVKEWHYVECTVLSNEITGNLRKNMNIIAITVLILATVEHYLINGYMLKTSLEASASFSEGMQNYFVTSNSETFSIVDYSFWLGCVFEFMNLQMAFIWNYVDVFIMLIGYALKFRLYQLNQMIRSYNKTKICNIHIWKSLRKDYLRVVSLCQSTNKRISTLILISFFINLYFVLKQIFKSLTNLQNSIEKAYFHTSFVLMVIRISCVIIFGSGVHDEWQEMSCLLQSVDSSAYNIEVERFIRSVTTYELVLSGKNFFGIRRSLILQIAGTIVTYELVIIQFTNDMLQNTV